MQQLFRSLILLIQPYMFRATNSPILSRNCWLYIQLLVQRFCILLVIYIVVLKWCTVTQMSRYVRTIRWTL